MKLLLKKIEIVLFIFFILNLQVLFSEAGNTIDLKITKNNKILTTKFTPEIKLKTDYPWNFYLSFVENFYFYKNTDLKNTHRILNVFLGTELTAGTAETKLGMYIFPLCCMDFFTELNLASGWSFPKFEFYGIAENKNNQGMQKIIPYNFSKLFISFTAGFNLYFKLSAVLKNKWADFKIGTGQFINYRALLPLDKNSFWFYKNDTGINRNGSVYKASYFIEYGMPLYLNNIRFEVNTQKRLYKPLPESSNLGELLWDTETGCILTFKLYEHIHIGLETYWSTDYVYVYSLDKMFFTEKILHSSKPQAFYFKRISVSLTFKI